MGLFSNFWNKVKEEAAKDESIKKSMEDLEKTKKTIAESQEAHDASKFLSEVGKTASATSEVLSEKFSGVFATAKKTAEKGAKTVKETADEVAESDVMKKIAEVAQEKSKESQESFKKVSKTAEKSAETVGKGVADSVAERLEGTRLGDAIKDTTKTINEALDGEEDYQKKYKNVKFDPPPPGSTAVELKSGSAWEQRWKELQENAYVKRVSSTISDAKKRIDESDNVIVARSRDSAYWVSDRVAEWSEYSQSETALVVAEAKKLDNNFDLARFEDMIMHDLAPSFIKAEIRGDLNEMKPLLGEAMYNQLAMAIAMEKYEGHLLDIRRVEMIQGSMNDYQPTFIYEVEAQVLSVVKSPTGEIIRGSEDEIQNRTYFLQLAPKQEDATDWRIVLAEVADTAMR